MCLGDGPVQTAGCPVTDELEQKHHAVVRVLGNRQVHTLPRLGGDLNDGIADSKKKDKERRLCKTKNIQHKTSVSLKQDNEPGVRTC